MITTGVFCSSKRSGISKKLSLQGVDKWIAPMEIVECLRLRNKFWRCVSEQKRKTDLDLVLTNIGRCLHTKEIVANPDDVFLKNGMWGVVRYYCEVVCTPSFANLSSRSCSRMRGTVIFGIFTAGRWLVWVVQLENHDLENSLNWDTLSNI